MKKMNIGKIVTIIVIVVLALATFAFAYDDYTVRNNGAGAGILDQVGATNALSQEAALARATKFISDVIMPNGGVKVKDVKTESGIYKFTIELENGQKYFPGLTKDGKYFFYDSVDVDTVSAQFQEKNAQAANTTPASTEISKEAKPKVEVFVMSHCPFGTQIEKGILPVADLLGDKIDFEIKFVDYAMHGEKELAEELSQYCIQKEQNSKYHTYLSCFITSGESDKCLTEASIDTKTMQSCVSATDEEFKVMKSFKDENKTGWKGDFPPFAIYAKENVKYGVEGSPTLVINGQKAQSERDSASLLKTICSSFIQKPSACDQVLSADQPSPGFGSGTADAGAASANCGQ
ncbi:MAG: hypothetical protein NTZ80_03825 [Patescibacteria group bacterium]|nr:hypothetical protein [Patescibacteria group bacterium]